MGCKCNGKATLYTTTQVAKICMVAPRTVCKWIDAGRLRGFRIPGSQDRRVTEKNLVEFMKANDYDDEMIPDDPDRDTKLLVIGATYIFKDVENEGVEGEGVEVTCVAGIFAGGIAFAETKPDVLAIDVMSIGRIDALAIGACLKGTKAVLGIIAPYADLEETSKSQEFHDAGYRFVASVENLTPPEATSRIVGLARTHAAPK